MSQIENSSQSTEFPPQTIESNFNWEIKNPLLLHDPIESKRIKIPSINGEWYLIVRGTSLQFHLHLNNYDESKFLKDPELKRDMYCFSFVLTGGSYSSVFRSLAEDKIILAVVLEPVPKILVIQAKVTIIKFHNIKIDLLDYENKLNKLSDDFGSLMSDSIHSDFTIIVKTKEFKVHKVVLSVRSPVFNTMFRSDMMEAADNIVKINDVEPCTFEQLLIFIYSGKIPEDLDYYAMDLFVAADKYEINDLKNECEKYIFANVSKDNAIDVFNLSNLYSCQYDLKKVSYEIIKNILQEPIIISDDLKTDDAKKLQQLLETKYSFETNLFETFKRDESEK